MCIQDFARCRRIDKCTCTTWFHVLHVEPSGEHQENTAWFNEIGSLASLMHVTQVHPVTTENQFHCTEVYAVWQNISLLHCTKWFIHTQRWHYSQWRDAHPKISRRVIMLECGKPQMTFCLTQYVPMLSTTQQPLVSLSPPPPPPGPPFLFFFFLKLLWPEKKSIKLKLKTKKKSI